MYTERCCTRCRDAPQIHKPNIIFESTHMRLCSPPHQCVCLARMHRVRSTPLADENINFMNFLSVLVLIAGNCLSPLVYGCIVNKSRHKGVWMPPTYAQTQRNSHAYRLIHICITSTGFIHQVGSMCLEIWKGVAFSLIHAFIPYSIGSTDFESLLQSHFTIFQMGFSMVGAPSTDSNRLPCFRVQGFPNTSCAYRERDVF